METDNTYPNISPHDLQDVPYPGCFLQCMTLNETCCTVYCPEKIKKSNWKQFRLTLYTVSGLFFALWFLRTLHSFYQG